MSTNDRRLIEDFLPIKEVSSESSREKSLRHGHISTLHLWWARRPLPVLLSPALRGEGWMRGVMSD
ncbi:MAG: DUF1156 domain-containing protein [Syntrophaceae bacterium]|nr:DUF1156 domain-containing protein [Syntrophaceae bacterium]